MIHANLFTMLYGWKETLLGIIAMEAAQSRCCFGSMSEINEKSIPVQQFKTNSRASLDILMFGIISLIILFTAARKTIIFNI